MKETGIVGLGASIIIDKKFVWAKGYGYADKESKKPFTISTIMNIGSIAKNFTGVCLMKAVEEKKIALDDDINIYLPFKIINPYFPNEKITIRNLATHTSGLADRYPFYDSTYLYGAGDSPEDLGGFLKSYFDINGKYYSKENFLNHKPGTYYEYSNLPAALAGYIIEIVTGKKLKFLRTFLKISYQKLSDIIDVPGSTLRLWEEKGNEATGMNAPQERQMRIFAIESILNLEKRHFEKQIIMSESFDAPSLDTIDLGRSQDYSYLKEA